jgi:hypothetical protein
MRKLTITAKIVAFITALLLLADIFFHFGKEVSHWTIYRCLFAAIIIIVYTTMMIQSYTAGNMRKLREMILIAVILFMVSVLVFFLA